MAGLADLLAMALKAVEVAPANNTLRCLNTTEGPGSCTVCLDVCPHQAVTISKEVVVDAVDCTGCGICVRACPSQALEMNSRLPAGSPTMRCSQVSGTAPSVRCLAQLSPTDMLRLGAASGSLRLAHGACSGCRVGHATVPEVARQTAQKAAQLADLLGKPMTVDIGFEAELEDKRGSSTVVSRRQLFGGGLREARRMMSDAVAPLERLLPVEMADEGPQPLPLELRRQYRALELAQLQPEANVPWVLPRVADGCIMCPACTRACPTDAFSRDFEGAEGALMLDPERCLGCDACVRACPVNVITLDPGVTWGELSGGKQEAYRPSPDKRPSGSFHR